MAKEVVLNKDGQEINYILDTESSGVWITVDNISVHIKRTDEGVVCDMYPLGCEMNESMASTYAFYKEAEYDIEEEAKAQA